MSGRLTLAEQLAQISQPAPDFDPEDSYATYGQERDQNDSVDLAAGRAEYLDVGSSKLRKRGEAVTDPKYSGKKSSRKALYGDQVDSGEEDVERDSDDQNEDGSLSYGSTEESESIETGSGEDEVEKESNAEDQAEDDEERVKGVTNGSDAVLSSSQQRSGKSSDREQNGKAILNQLKEAASADVEKGRDVKKQFAFGDNLFEARIMIQKALTSASSLPQAHNSASYYAQVQEELSEAVTEVQSLNDELSILRRDLLKDIDLVDESLSLGAGRKRKRTDKLSDESLVESLQDLASLNSVLEPYLRATVSKWSDKVMAASGLNIGRDKKFKAVNQNIMVQIDHTLADSERDRLVKRTRVKRGPTRVVGKMNEVTLEGEKVDVDVEIFDDGDFYQQLLRDVVESRMLDVDDATLSSLRLASARSKKVKKVVDTRASKGRKIRYHVHEKIQSFMIPIQAGSWHEEQTDELFSSLLGRSFPKTVDHAEDEKETLNSLNGASVVDGGSLRIFG